MRARPAVTSAPTLPVAALALVLGAHAGLKALFFWTPYQASVAFPVEGATGGLVTAVTLAGVVSWVLLVGILMVGVCGLRPRHVGLTWGAFLDALPILLWAWILIQGVQATLGAATGDVSLALPQDSLSAALGQRVQAVVGSGLLEEVLYRGFLLAQVYGLLRRRLSRDSALVWAIGASSVYFGLNHIPAGLSAGLPPTEVALFAFHSALVGALFAALYLRTGNLFLAAGGHALINDPVPFVTSPVDPQLVALIGVAALLLAWPSLARRFKEVFTVGVVEGTPAV